jgi:hypothetical protein
MSARNIPGCRNAAQYADDNYLCPKRVRTFISGPSDLYYVVQVSLDRNTGSPRNIRIQIDRRHDFFIDYNGRHTRPVMHIKDNVRFARIRLKGELCPVGKEKPKLLSKNSHLSKL